MVLIGKLFRPHGYDRMSSKVHITRCPEYDLDQIKPQIKNHLDQYPRFKDIGGKKVLLKINLLSATEPERAVTTHPTFLKALVLEIQDRGGSVLIADSPGGLFNKGTLTKAYREAGIQKVADETGAELNYNFNSHEEKHRDGRFLKRFNICDYISSCDLTIAVPKIKTHMFCGLTCAMKIMFGAVPGTEKVKYHTRFPDTLDFSKMLLDLTDLCKVDLFLVDGIIGMDGKGPARGDPREVGSIVSGEDPTTVDLQVTRMVGLDPSKLPITKAAKEQGLIDLDQKIDVTGDGSDLRISPKFKPAKGGALATSPPSFLKRFIINISTNKPHVGIKKCIGCGVCRDNCAGDAIVIINEKAKIDHSKCIRCYCCHELCPHDAIYLTIKESGLGNFIGDMGYRMYGTVRDNK